MYNTIITAMIILFPLVASMQDIWSLSVFRIVWYVAIPLSFIIHGIFQFDMLRYHLIVSVVSFCFYFLIRLLTGKGLGFADVLMGTFMGSILNLDKMIFAVVFQILTSLIYFSIARFVFRKSSELKMPFIPVMTLSLWIIWII